MTESLLRTAALNEVLLHAFCVMPDHVHLIASPSHRCDIVQLVGRIKGHATRALRAHGTPLDLWQRSFWDHFLHADEDLTRAVAYVVEIPVRAGLVARHSNYPFSGGSTD